MQSRNQIMAHVRNAHCVLHIGFSRYFFARMVPKSKQNIKLNENIDEM